MPVLVVVLLVGLLLFLFVGGFALTALFFHLIPWIILGLVAGWIGSKIVGANTTLFEDLLAGVAGAVIGGWIFTLFTHSAAGGTLSIGNLIVAIIGSAVILGVHKAYRGSSTSSNRLGA